MPEHDGSQVKYLRSAGLLGPNVGLAHSVWMRPDEIEILAETGTNVILNPVGNLKTRSGVPPIRGYLDAGVPTAMNTRSAAPTSGPGPIVNWRRPEAALRPTRSSSPGS